MQCFRRSLGGYFLQFHIQGGSVIEGYLSQQLQVLKRVLITLVEVNERLGKFVIPVCKKVERG